MSSRFAGSLLLVLALLAVSSHRSWCFELPGPFNMCRDYYCTFASSTAKLEISNVSVAVPDFYTGQINMYSDNFALGDDISYRTYFLDDGTSSTPSWKEDSFGHPCGYFIPGVDDIFLEYSNYKFILKLEGSSPYLDVGNALIYEKTACCTSRLQVSLDMAETPYIWLSSIIFPIENGMLSLPPVHSTLSLQEPCLVLPEFVGDLPVFSWFVSAYSQVSNPSEAHVTLSFGDASFTVPFAALDRDNELCVRMAELSTDQEPEIILGRAFMSQVTASFNLSVSGDEELVLAQKCQCNAADDDGIVINAHPGSLEPLHITTPQVTSRIPLNIQNSTDNEILLSKSAMGGRQICLELSLNPAISTRPLVNAPLLLAWRAPSWGGTWLASFLALLPLIAFVFTLVLLSACILCSCLLVALCWRCLKHWGIFSGVLSSSSRACAHHLRQHGHSTTMQGDSIPLLSSSPSRFSSYSSTEDSQTGQGSPLAHWRQSNGTWNVAKGIPLTANEANAVWETVGTTSTNVPATSTVTDRTGNLSSPISAAGDHQLLTAGYRVDNMPVNEADDADSRGRDTEMYARYFTGVVRAHQSHFTESGALQEMHALAADGTLEFEEEEEEEALNHGNSLN